MRKVTNKILFMTIGMALFLSSVLSVYMVNSFMGNSRQQISELERTLLHDFDMLIKSEVETMLSLVQTIEADQREGKYAPGEARELATHLIRESRFGESGYFWVDRSDGTNVVLLGNDSEGSNRYDLQDAQGNYMIRDLIEAALNGGGYVNYYFPKSGGDIPLPKRGYTAYFKPYDWVIGTGNYIDDIQLILDEKEKIATGEMKRNISVSMMITVSSLFIVALLSLILGKRISNPLVHASQLAARIAKGELDIEIDSRFKGLKDETGRMLNAFDDMAGTLNRTIRSISDASNQVSSGASQISETTQMLSSGASEQAASVEQISSSMEQLTANIQQNQENSLEADDIAKKVSREATLGGESVAETVKAMTSIAEKIIVIDEIARNTNMLALNAAIEAARAGDAGKGFAVVASEVRKLAENSGKAAGEIAEISSNSLSIANKAGQIINDLIPQIQRTSEHIQNINAASREQSAGAEQINLGIKQLDLVIQQNASSSEELASMAEELSSQAIMMEENVNQFKISEEKALVLREEED